MGTRVIAVVGPAGSGKTTLAEKLAEEFGARRLSIADGVRRVAGFTYGQDVFKGKDYAVGDDLRTGREVLQGVGAALRRWDQYFWLRPISALIDELEDELVVIDDVRLCDEADWLRARHNTFVVLLTAPRDVRASRSVVIGENDATETEWQLVKPDLVIDTSENNTEAVLKIVAEEVVS